MNTAPATSLSIVSFNLGPALTNAYLVGNSEVGTAVVIDPAWDGKVIAAEAARRNWRITDIWLTHAHFDHFGGAGAVSDSGEAPIPVALHPDDQPLWRAMGGASWFGMTEFDPGPEPTIPLSHGMRLRALGREIEVRHTPGHSPGHVVFVFAEDKRVVCGDLIFEAGVGRTDLPGGDWDTLLRSIRDQIFTLPEDTVLLPGHGRPTTVGRERAANPFLQGDL
ncbi:MAG TPA: MBL fold metallo-hydrolase [Anaerolineales bacterium]|nr:MBL fold metallo-hydrolase [Anaerolineales bacterium]